ncbi:hypothetical protein ACSS6W_009850 [Trichoderma asperelloides]
MHAFLPSHSHISKTNPVMAIPILPPCSPQLLLLSSSGLSLLESLLRQSAQLLSGSAQAAGVGALDHGLAVDGNLLALLEEEEGGHGGDAVAGGNLGDVVDVDLGKGEGVFGAVLVGERLVDGGDGLAGRAPVGVEVDGDVGVCGEERVELLGGLDVVDVVGAHFGCDVCVCVLVMVEM